MLELAEWGEGHTNLLGEDSLKLGPPRRGDQCLHWRIGMRKVLQEWEMAGARQGA